MSIKGRDSLVCIIIDRHDAHHQMKNKTTKKTTKQNQLIEIDEHQKKFTKKKETKKKSK